MTQGTFLRKAKKDKRYKAFQKMLDSGMFKQDIPGLLNELERMHVTRKIPLLKRKDVLTNAQKELIDGGLQNQAYRSRCTHIKITCYRVSAELADHLETLSAFIRNKYSSLLASECKTIGDRDNAIQVLFEDAYRLDRDLGTVMEICDIIVEDIDKAGFSLNHVIQTLKISAAPERNI